MKKVFIIAFVCGAIIFSLPQNVSANTQITNILLQQIVELTKIVEILREEIALLRGEPRIPDVEGYVFEKDLAPEDRDIDVILLQKTLNKAGFTVAKQGDGSVGNESDYYGPLTREAVKRLQASFATLALHPAGYFLPTGIVDVHTRNVLNRITAQFRASKNSVIGISQTKPFISSISPISGPNGSKVIITGGNFDRFKNTINTTYEVFDNIPSFDGRTLEINIFSSELENRTTGITELLEDIDENDEVVSDAELLENNAFIPENTNATSPVAIHVVNQNGTSGTIVFDIELENE